MQQCMYSVRPANCYVGLTALYIPNSLMCLHTHQMTDSRRAKSKDAGLLKSRHVYVHTSCLTQVTAVFKNSTYLSNSRISGAAYAKVVCTLWLELEMEVLPMMRASPTSHILAEVKSLDSNTLPLLMSLCTICRKQTIDNAVASRAVLCFGPCVE